VTVAENEDRDESAPAGPRSALPVSILIALAWLLPGLGHLLLGRRLRAAVFACVIFAAFAVGLVLDGELALPVAGDPLSYLATIACLGNGALYVVAKYFGLGVGVVRSAGWEYGNTFMLTAGMMNLLLLLDVHDVASGRKDW
jgi:hypothetical protein